MCGKGAAVVQSGQRVKIPLMLQPLALNLRIGHILDEAHLALLLLPDLHKDKPQGVVRAHHLKNKFVSA